MKQSVKKWSPSRYRIILAFAIAPGLAAFAMAATEPLYAGLDNQFERIWRTAIAFALLGAYPSALLFGVPTYFFLHQKIEPTWLICSLTGAFVAAIPWILIMLIGPSADQASIGGKATVMNGSRTLYGWISDLGLIGQIALFGALAGFLFWAIVTVRRKVH